MEINETQRHLHNIEPVGVRPHEDGRRVGQRQAGGQSGRLLSEALHPRGVCAFAGRAHRALEVVRHRELEPAAAF